MMDFLLAFAGGALIGLASVLMLLFNGRILGISGIVGGIFEKRSKEQTWRYLFIAGIFTGGAVLNFVSPSAFTFSLSRSPLAIIAAGLLVGYGTRLGGGCTSGHGICGISRLSPRSIMATITFMAFGAATVFVINHLLGGAL